MARPYVYERQSEYWTSRGIEDYFLDLGCQVVTFPLTARSESAIPFDFLFVEEGTSKLFALQYKALYQNGRDHWRLDETQHRNLQCYRDWGYYCFSELTDPEQFRVAIHHALFVPVVLAFSPRVERGSITSRYYRWGAFAEGIRRCTTGLRVKSESDVLKALERNNQNLSREIQENFIDFFVANLERKRVLHLPSGGLP